MQFSTSAFPSETLLSSAEWVQQWPQMAISQWFVVTDAQIATLVYPSIKELFPAHHLLEVPAGEAAKSFQEVQHLIGALTKAGADRQSAIIALGGGSITDLVGLVASLYKRGIQHVNIPTTLLAMADAAIGGKNGIDFGEIKNLVGTFKQADAIVMLPQVLDTLPERELLSGWAEVVKMLLVTQNTQLFDVLKQDLEEVAIIELATWAAQAKQAIVAQDPFDQGVRQILNFGHTLGHAIEATLLLSPDRAVTHGEAVVAGMLMALYLSHTYHGLPESDWLMLEEYLFSMYGVLPLTLEDKPSILAAVKQDKKNKEGQVKMIMLPKLGHPDFGVSISQEQLNEALDYYLAG